MGIEYSLHGSYATPLALLDKLAANSHQDLIIDDSGGVFSSPLSVSLLNVAYWPSADTNGKRRVIWISTIGQHRRPRLDGKIIVLTNLIPATPQAHAFVN
jgi:hypothetical protein